MKQILIMAPCRARHKAMLERIAPEQCRFIYNEHPTASELAQANIILGEPDIADITNSSVLEWVQMTWAGTDKYTKFPGFPRQALLTNATGAFGSVIAEYAFAGILSLFRRFPAYREQQKQALWQGCGSERTIEGCRVLILGAGDIGQSIAKRMQAFGAHVTGVCRTMRDIPHFDALATLQEIDSLLPQADIVIGCLPNTAQTVQLLDRRRLLLMKKDALLVNVGRGSLIETDALADVMTNGHLFGAVLDVFAPEPLPAEHPLWTLENVLITPHIAGPSFHHSPQTEDKIYSIFCENLQCFLSGQPLCNEISWETGYRKLMH